MKKKPPTTLIPEYPFPYDATTEDVCAWLEAAAHSNMGISLPCAVTFGTQGDPTTILLRDIQEVHAVRKAISAVSLMAEDEYHEKAARWFHLTWDSLDKAREQIEIIREAVSQLDEVPDGDESHGLWAEDKIAKEGKRSPVFHGNWEDSEKERVRLKGQPLTIAPDHSRITGEWWS